MTHKSFILVAALLLMLVGGAVAIYLYDSSREDLIAEGVTVAGHDVGGMTTAEARTLVRRKVAAPLERPLVVRHRGRRFTLSAADAGLKADVGGMVDEALEESREGSILSRVARDLTGGEEDAAIEARVSYSERAVAGLVERVKRKVNRPARDATVQFPSLTQVKEQNGIAVKTGALQARLERAAVSPGSDRTLKAPIRVTRPEVTQAELADQYPVLLVADRGSFQLRLYKRLQLARSYTIAVGQLGFDTPAGLYHIQNKAVNPAWSVPNAAWAGSLAGQVIPGGTAENPLKARWLGIYDGAGIHGTDQTYTLGSAASHGCIRMSIPDVIEVYDTVPVGAPIYIA
jgi:lipoprotein-anchoring transpeptidase ErfK/SrfK